METACGSLFLEYTPLSLAFQGLPSTTMGCVSAAAQLWPRNRRAAASSSSLEVLDPTHVQMPHD